MQKLFFHLGPEEYFFIALQIGLISCVLLGWTRRLRWPRQQPSMSACLLAICAGWSCRLAGMFILMSAGFNYSQSDDPNRWLKALGWSYHPRLVTGIWPPGTSVFHGLAMNLIRDPLVASKVVAILLCLLSLVGIFVFTLGVFANRWLACAAVLAAAPQWLHVVLSTGAMSEMPTVAFMLSGSGLLLLGLRRPSRRIRWLSAAAFCFNLGTAFHTTAWMQLAAILTVLLAYALSSRGKASGFPVSHWLCFSTASCLFCLVYGLACWREYGSPFAIFQMNTVQLLHDNGHYPFGVRLYAYPLAIAYTYRAALPLLGFGMAWSWFSRDGNQQARRAILLAGGLTLLILMGTTLNGAVSTQGYRSLIVLSTALIPFMLAPFFPDSADSPGGPQSAGGTLRHAQKLAFWGCVVAAVYCFVSQNYHYGMERISNYGSDTAAVGTWLRQEMIQPSVLKPADLALPVRIYQPEGGNFNIFPLIGEVRFFNRIETKPKSSMDSLRPGQLVVSPTPVADPRMQPVTQIGSIFIYRFQSRQAELPGNASGKSNKPKGL